MSLVKVTQQIHQPNNKKPTEQPNLNPTQKSTCIERTTRNITKIHSYSLRLPNLPQLHPPHEAYVMSCCISFSCLAIVFPFSVRLYMLCRGFVSNSCLWIKPSCSSSLKLRLRVPLLVVSLDSCACLRSPFSYRHSIMRTLGIWTICEIFKSNPWLIMS